MRKDTLITHAGRSATGPVNPPVMRASTILFEDIAAYDRTRSDRFAGLRYGVHGTDTQFALEQALTALEGCHRAIILPSGLAAIAVSLTAILNTDDHLLVSDSVYGPTRQFCDRLAARSGIEITYYDPLIGEDIAALLQENTKAVFCESPGSFTFEVQDIPGIVAAAHARGVLVLLDNSWASPLFFDAMGHGVDICIQAATKYITGHSDVMMGTIATTEALWRKVRDTVADYGFAVGADDCYLALRGLRTLAVRLRHQQASALHIARSLATCDGVARVLYPALEGDPGYPLWQRDFTGASGLFGVVLDTPHRAAATAFLDALQLFGIGSSWGGYESLALPARFARSTPQPELGGELVRLHIGLEDSEDLLEDLMQALQAMRAHGISGEPEDA